MDLLEILSPAGSMDSLKAAINAGCDALYIGGTSFGARASANNLVEEDMLYAIDYAHTHGKDIFLTVNTLIKNENAQKFWRKIISKNTSGKYTEKLNGENTRYTFEFES